MPRLEKNWQIANLITAEADKNLIGYPSLLRQILFNRGFATLDDSQHYLAALPPAINDPFLIKGMGESVDRGARSVIHSSGIVKNTAFTSRHLKFYESDSVTSLNPYQSLLSRFAHSNNEHLY